MKHKMIVQGNPQVLPVTSASGVPENISIVHGAGGLDPLDNPGVEYPGKSVA